MCNKCGCENPWMGRGEDLRKSEGGKMKSFKEYCEGCPMRIPSEPDVADRCKVDSFSGVFTKTCHINNCVGYYSYTLAWEEFKEKISDRWKDI